MRMMRKRIDRQATPALRQAVEQRLVNGSAAARVVDRPLEVQERAVKLVTRKEVRTAKAAVERIEQEISEAAGVGGPGGHAGSFP